MHDSNFCIYLNIYPPMKRKRLIRPDLQSNPSVQSAALEADALSTRPFELHAEKVFLSCITVVHSDAKFNHISSFIKI